MRTQSPTTKGGSMRVCSVRRSEVRIWRLRKASSRSRRESRHVSWGWYFPRWTGMKSLMGRPKTHTAGERCVSRSGVLRYWSMALWNWSVFKDPSVAVLSVMSRLTVFTPTSARQLLCGNATDDRRQGSTYPTARQPGAIKTVLRASRFEQFFLLNHIWSGIEKSKFWKSGKWIF